MQVNLASIISTYANNVHLSIKNVMQEALDLPETLKQ